jgi:hypothetical protein
VIDPRQELERRSHRGRLGRDLGSRICDFVVDADGSRFPIRSRWSEVLVRDAELRAHVVAVFTDLERQIRDAEHEEAT